MEAAIRAILAADAGVIALVVDRIYAIHLPQNPTLPAVVFSRVSTLGRDLTQDGTLRIAQGIFQLTSFAQTIAGAKALGDAVRKAVRDKKGTFGGEEVLRVQFMNESDMYDLDLGLYAEVIDVSFLVRED